MSVETNRQKDASFFQPILEPKDEELKKLYQTALSMGWRGDSPTCPGNLVTYISCRPDLLSMFLDGSMTLQLKGRLPPTVIQMICMAISYQNKCRYCAVCHNKILQAMGVSDQVIRSCASDENLSHIPPTERAVVKFALKVAANPRDIKEEDYQSLLDAGITQEEIMEIIFLASFENFMNSISDAAKIPLDSFWAQGEVT